MRLSGATYTVGGGRRAGGDTRPYGTRPGPAGGPMGPPLHPPQNTPRPPRPYIKTKRNPPGPAPIRGPPLPPPGPRTPLCNTPVAILRLCYTCPGGVDFRGGVWYDTHRGKGSCTSLSGKFWSGASVFFHFGPVFLPESDKKRPCLKGPVPVQDGDLFPDPWSEVALHSVLFSGWNGGGRQVSGLFGLVLKAASTSSPGSHSGGAKY